LPLPLAIRRPEGLSSAALALSCFRLVRKRNKAPVLV
jgi:hypothetical protein